MESQTQPMPGQLAFLRKLLRQKKGSVSYTFWMCLVCSSLGGWGRIVLAGVRPDWTKDSTFPSQYESPIGIVEAMVQIRENNGTYTLYDGTVGELSRFKYHPQFRDQYGKVSGALTGIWQLGGNVGYFVFREPNEFGEIDGYFGRYYPDGTPTPSLGSWDAITPTPLAIALPSVQPNIQPLNLFPSEVGTRLQVPEAPSSKSRPEVNIGNPQAVSATVLDRIPKIRRMVGAILTMEEMGGRYQSKSGTIKNVTIPAGTQVGTCIMAGDGIAIASRHVYERIDKPTKTELCFPEEMGNAFRHCPVLGNPIFSECDVAIIQFNGTGNNPWTLADLIRTIPDSEKQQVRGTANILHYPGNGLSQSWSTDDSVFVKCSKKTSHLCAYTGDTSDGSSGGAVFDSHFRLVAIHYGALDLDLIVSDEDEKKEVLSRSANIRLVNAGYSIREVQWAITSKLATISGGAGLIQKMGLSVNEGVGK